MTGHMLRKAVCLSFIGDAIILEEIRLQVKIIQQKERNAKGIHEKTLSLIEKLFLEAESTEPFAFPEGLHATRLVMLFPARINEKTARPVPYFLFFWR